MSPTTKPPTAAATAPTGPVGPTAEALAAWVKNNEALAHLNSSMAGLQAEYVDHKRQVREANLTLAAKLDNLDRTVSEMKMTAEHAEASRQAELQRIFALLGDERKDRKEITASAGKDERELLREMIREEMEGRRRQGGLVVDAGKAIWAAGGRYIVLAIAVLLVAAVMKATGLNLADILGLAGK